jgi:DNA-binding PadR family transcriptional regulator
MYSRKHHGACHPRHIHHRSGRHHWRGRGGGRARRGDVRAAIIALLAEQPMHGYEMIREIEERSEGFWKPSAGSIYPTLQLLEEQGLIEAEEADGKRRFSLTDEGHNAADEQSQGDRQSPWEQVRSGAPAELVQLGTSVQQLRAAVAQALNAADEAQRGRIRELLDETRRGIYSILAEED